MDQPGAPATKREGKRLIQGGIIAFLVTCVALLFIGGKLAPTSHPEPGFPIDEKARASRDGTFQVTLDASDRTHWLPFDLAGGTIQTAPPGNSQSDTSGDLIIRRHSLRAPHGALNLGNIPLASAHLPANPEWQHDTETSGEQQNPAFNHWYHYSYWTHLLRSAGDTYAVRLAAGGVAYLNIVSYYCQPEGPGCLTLRYRLDFESPTGK